MHVCILALAIHRLNNLRRRCYGKTLRCRKKSIIVGIGSKDGFLSTMCFEGKKKNKNQDYHSEMYAEHFEEWFGNVLNEIPDKSVVVLDQASYHKRITDETRNLTTAFRKQEIIDWLVSHKISLPECYSEFSEMTVPLLLDLARRNKIQPVYQVEKLAQECGKDIKLFWLPVAHCELNPIELIWSAVKSM